MPLDNISQEDFLKKVTEHLKEKADLNDFELVDNLEALENSIITYINKGNYQQAVLALMQHRDERNGIHWDWIEGRLDILVRDARNQNTDPIESYEGYAILVIQYMRGVLALLEAEGIAIAEINDKPINQYLIETVRQLQNSKNLEKDFTTINLEIIANYIKAYNKKKNANLKFDKAQKRIAIAKDCVNLDNPSFHIATLTSVTDETKNKHSVLEGEIARCQLTNKQKTRLENCDNEAWFTTLPEWQQKLIKPRIQHILEENRVIPTQLRFLPGLRNAYQKVTQIDPEKAASPTLSVFHSGTILTYLKDDGLETTLTNENAQQLQQNATSVIEINEERSSAAEDTSSVHFITLNAKSKGAAHDKNIVKKTRVAIEALGKPNIHTNACVNGVRKISKESYPGIEQQLAAVIDFLNSQNINENLKQLLIPYLTSGKTNKLVKQMTQTGYRQSVVYDSKKDVFSGLIKELNNRQNEFRENQNLFNLIHVAIATKHAIINHNQPLQLDSNNHNLQLVAYSHLINQYLRNFGVSQPINASACQSGKDRNGLVLLASSVYYVWQQLGADVTTSISDFKGDVLKQFARSGHTQFMANMTGYGCFGIKNDPTGAIPEGWKYIENLLILKTASFNKLPPIPNAIVRAKDRVSRGRQGKQQNPIMAYAQRHSPQAPRKSSSPPPESSISKWDEIWRHYKPVIIAVGVLAGAAILGAAIGLTLGLTLGTGLFALMIAAIPKLSAMTIAPAISLAGEAIFTALVYTAAAAIPTGFFVWKKQKQAEMKIDLGGMGFGDDVPVGPAAVSPQHDKGYSSDPEKHHRRNNAFAEDAIVFDGQDRIQLDRNCRTP